MEIIDTLRFYLAFDVEIFAFRRYFHGLIRLFKNVHSVSRTIDVVALCVCVYMKRNKHSLATVYTKIHFPFQFQV